MNAPFVQSVCEWFPNTVEIVFHVHVIKTQHQKNKAPPQPVLTGCPMQIVAVDILGPLPQTNSGNKYILVAGDYFSKWVEAYQRPTKKQQQ